MRALWVGIAGALGAMSRYGIGLAIGPQVFPWATLGINVTGSFALGFILTYAIEGHLSTDASTAIVYVVASVVLGIAAAAGGYALARAVR